MTDKNIGLTLYTALFLGILRTTIMTISATMVVLKLLGRVIPKRNLIVSPIALLALVLTIPIARRPTRIII